MTWLELALSFSHFAGAALPIIRNNTEGMKQMITVSTPIDCAAYGITLYDLSCCMQTMRGHFVFCLDENEQPKVDRGKNGSLIYLGYEGHAAGLMTRPSFPGQLEVLDFVRSQLKGKANHDVLTCPPWIQEERRFELKVHEWDPLRIASYAKRREVRRMA